MFYFILIRYKINEIDLLPLDFCSILFMSGFDLIYYYTILNFFQVFRNLVIKICKR